MAQSQPTIDVGTVAVALWVIFYFTAFEKRFVVLEQTVAQA